MSEIMKIGLVGAGAIAQAYISALKQCPGGTLQAVADTRPDVAKVVAESCQCEAYGSHLELIDRSECDAVIICTPPSTHADIAVSFLRQGIPVLCEKPLSTDVESARLLSREAQSHDVAFTMASKFRYVEDVIHTKSILASGLVGDVVLIENTLSSTVDMSRRWNSDPEIGGGGVLIDNGTHSVDIVRYLVGPITEVSAFEGRRVQDIPVEDTVSLFMRTESGADANVDLSWTINKARDTYIRVYGSHGIVQVGWGQSRYRQITSPDWIVFGSGYDKIGAFQNQLNNFIGHIRDREPLLISDVDAVASVEVIQAAYQSMRAARPVKLRQPPNITALQSVTA